MNNESMALFYRDAKSDKQYNVELVSVGDLYVVNFAYGRRGGTMKAGTKTATPLPYEQAKKLYDKIVRGQLADGYTPSGEGTPFAGTDNAGRSSGLQLQLSNAISEAEARALLHNPDYVAQEKKDGERRPAKHDGMTITGVNKKGLTVALPAAIVSTLTQLLGAAKTTTFDAEIIGDTLYVFDLLEYNGDDLTSTPLWSRLETLATVAFDATVQLLPTARTTEEKIALFERVQRENGEGIVFKHRASLCTAGRPASGGDHLKFKFVEEATVKVLRPNLGKRSVVMGLHDGAGRWREVGSVTIPANAELPSTGTYLEVQYLYAFPGEQGSLFQPVYKTIRADQGDEDCILAQLKFKPVADAAAA